MRLFNFIGLFVGALALLQSVVAGACLSLQRQNRTNTSLTLRRSCLASSEAESSEPVVLAIAQFPESNAFGRAYSVAARAPTVVTHSRGMQMW